MADDSGGESIHKSDRERSDGAGLVGDVTVKGEVDASEVTTTHERIIERFEEDPYRNVPDIADDLGADAARVREALQKQYGLGKYDAAKLVVGRDWKRRVEERGESGVSYPELADDYGVNKSTIGQAVRWFRDRERHPPARKEADDLAEGGSGPDEGAGEPPVPYRSDDEFFAAVGALYDAGRSGCWWRCCSGPPGRWWCSR